MEGDATVLDSEPLLHALEPFRQLNPHCTVSVNEGRIGVDKPWGTDEIRLVFDAGDSSAVGVLNSLLLPPQFDALIHLDTNTAEFIFAYLNPTDPNATPYIDRDFEFAFEGVSFHCYFAVPTEQLYAVARSSRKLPSPTSSNVVPQLHAFKDAQRIEELKDLGKKYFMNRVPRSFFVVPNAPLSSIDLEAAFRHLNFIMKYYDRNSPEIIIRKSPNEADLHEAKELRLTEGTFPTRISLVLVDDFILQLLESARYASPRFGFIYYYQILEYAGFHYVDQEARKQLRRILRDPAVVNCSDDKLEELFSVMTAVSNNDEARMKQVVEQFCDPQILWREISIDREFFASPVEFRGGFGLAALISKDTTADSWASMWMPKTYDFLTKIRNSLVHARERRLSKVVLPGIENSLLIEHYLRLMRRVAEQVAIQS